MLEEETRLTAETARAMRELARTVTDAPPLRLAPRRGARAPRPLLPRRWHPWVVPLAAAVAVIALAVSLAIIRDLPDGRAVPPASPKPAPSALPTYHAALSRASGGSTAPERIVISDTFTGQRVAIVAPPAGTTFAGITGAADDRTFVVDTQPGSLGAENEPTQPRTWYSLRIAPGTRTPATLTRLPIPVAADTDVDAMALSPDAAMLAVATQTSADGGEGVPVHLTVYSVRSGAALHSWSSFTQGLLFGGFKAAGPDRDHALAWTTESSLAFSYGRLTLDADHDVASSSSVTVAQVLSFSLGTPADADFLLNSTVFAPLVAAPGKPPFALNCGLPTLTDVLVADRKADGQMLVCGAAGTTRAPGPLNARHCSSGPAWNRLGLVEYSATTLDLSRVLAQYTTTCSRPLATLEPLWTNPSGTMQLGMLGLGKGTPAFGIFTKGTFKPLPMPLADDTAASFNPVNYIAW